MEAVKPRASVSSSANSADVIIVGAGHNGLIAACYLARAGVDVLVVEAYHKAGGMTTTSPMVEVPSHLINEGSIQASLFNATTIDKELELSSRFGLSNQFIDPYHVHLGRDGESLAFWRDYRKTADEIRYFSPKDAESWLKLCATIDRAVKIGLPIMRANAVRPEFKMVMQSLGAAIGGFGEIGNIARWAVAPFAEAVEASFEHPMVRGPMTSLLAFGNYKADLGGWGMIYFGLIHRYGASMFKGGTGSLPLALLRCLEAAKGRVRVAAPVEELMVVGGRVTGVRLTGGEELTARKAVMTTLNPKRVLTELLPRGVLTTIQQKRAEYIPTLERGITDYNLNVAVKGKLHLPRHEKWRKDGLDLRVPCVTWNTHEQSLAAYDACNRGEIPGMIPGLAQISTAFDPTMAPPGHDTLWYWTPLTPSKPRVGWEVARDGITNLAIKDMAQYYEGIEEMEIGRHPQVLPDLAKRFWALDGNVYHIDTFITRMGLMKPAIGFAGYKTPIPGLYLSGAGTHPVAGICGLPGQNAARTLLRNIRKSKA
jgi:phytoene dehydrogenase-like protein